jgi:hypothetical protein
MGESLPKLDKRHFTITHLNDTNEEKAYWLSRTPEERLAAIEISRRMVYGENASTSRLQRIFEVLKLSRR